MTSPRLSRDATPDTAPILATVVLALVCFFAIASATHWADGGHVSLDAVQQLVEAATGASVSWSPPFMSAVLQWLGTDVAFDPVVAMERFVQLLVLLLYGGLLLAAAPVRAVPWLWPRVVAASLLLLHPVLMAYAGIVWKDVLLAAIVAGAFGAGLASLAHRGVGSRVALAALCMFFAALMPHVRQHGMILAPAVALLPLLSILWTDGLARRLRLALSVLLVLLFVGTLLGAGAWSDARVRDDHSDSTSVGFRSVFIFDLAGIEARVDAGPLRERGLSVVDDARLVEVYTPDRIDTLPGAAGFDALVGAMSVRELHGLWWRSVLRFPGAYFRHRAAVWTRMLGAGEGGVCLPVHLGIGGPEHQLAALGLPGGTDTRDHRVYERLQPLFGTPMFSQAWTLAALMVVALRIVFLPRRSRIALGVPALAALATYASFALVGIACDYRYLFVGLVMTVLLWVVSIMGWRASGDAGTEGLR